jgi:HEAT repeat protein
MSSFWERFIGRSEPPDDAQPGGFSTLEEMNLQLADAFSPRSSVARRARENFYDYLTALPAEDLPRVDEQIRRSFGRYHSTLSRPLKPRDLDRLSLDRCGWAALALASANPNGYVREAAVCLLAAGGQAHSIGLLLIRANDWVESVRFAAVHGLRNMLPPLHAAEWVRHLPLVFRLQQCGRADHRELVADIVRRMQQPVCEPALRQGLFSGSAQLRHACLAVTQALAPAASIPLLKEALFRGEPVLRANIARSLPSIVPPDALASVAAELQRDPFMPVRRAALYALLETSPGSARELLEHALFDRHASLRELARFHLPKLGPSDLRERYLAALEQAAGPALVIAVLGLGETGSPADFPRLQPYLDVESIRLRKAALTAAARLDRKRANPHLIEALSGPSPGVSREASRLLAAPYDPSNYEDIRTVFGSARLLHVRRNAFRVLMRASKWKQLAPIVAAWADPDERIQQHARAALERWHNSFNRSFVSPTRAEMADASAALRAAEAHLPPSLRHRLQSLFASYSPQ